MLDLRVVKVEERLDFFERLLSDGRNLHPLPGRAHR